MVCLKDPGSCSISMEFISYQLFFGTVLCLDSMVIMELRTEIIKDMVKMKESVPKQTTEIIEQ